RPIAGLADSKKLTARRREQLFLEIRDNALCYAVAQCSREEIDELNILQASLLSMTRAIEALAITPHRVIVDGNRCPQTDLPVQAIVKGDLTEPAISAASILAKVTRDRQMVELHQEYPQFGFDQHKGYPTKVHQERLLAFGVTGHHRLSYRPVAELGMPAIALTDQSNMFAMVKFYRAAIAKGIKPIFGV
ncbi:unnamed protein product, partial [Cyprideis torosa]